MRAHFYLLKSVGLILGQAEHPSLRRDNVDATIFWSSPFGGRDVNRFNIGCRDYIFYDYREDNSSIHDLGTSTEFPANKWTHHAFVRLGNVYEVYVNGILVKSTTDNNSNLPNLKGWRISGRVCRDNDMNYCSFNGQLDEVRFFNYAKRGWEIKQMMNSKLSGKEPGLIGYWDFNEGYGNTVHDKSISKMHGDFLKLEGGNSDWVISTCPVK